MAATTRLQLVQRIARRYGRYITGTATGGSTTTIVDSTLLDAPDDYYNDRRAYILTDAGGSSAAPEGEERRVSDFDQSTYTATVGVAFTAAVAADDIYELLPVRRAEITEAINTAVRAARGYWDVFSEDTTTITLAASTYSYSLPTDLVTLNEMVRRAASTEPWTMVPRRDYEMAGTPGAQVLYLHNIGSVGTSDTLMLRYTKRLTALSADSTTLGIGEPYEDELVQYVIEYALMILHETAMGQGGDSARVHATLVDAHDRRAQELAGRARHVLAGHVTPETWSRSIG